MTKKVYRVRNWGEYNKALIKRGSITFWFNEDVMKSWYAKPDGKKGRARTYSEAAIECCALLRLWFNKPLRGTQGLMISLLELLKVDLKVPCYSQVSRREKTLLLKLKHSVREPIHVVLDGTGLKVFGEGEWKVRQHSYSKRRMWRKLHIGLDVETQEVVMAELTDNHIGENKLLVPLLEQYADGFTKVGADKGYDSFDCHEQIGIRGAESAILIQRKSKVRKSKTKTGPPLVRDEIVRRIRVVGRKGWKAEVGYHKRSLVETAFFRFKTLFGDKLHAHSLENQKIEALLCCNMMNQFTQLGMPDSLPIN
jgi:hypothetical protein